MAHLIKKCNDFGAGGVSVAIGELADGLRINLDKVPKKYAGLDGTELAISESQERMAVVLDPNDVEQFMEYAREENLEAVCVAEVTKEPRLVLCWRGKEIVNLSRAFLDTNGAHQENDVYVALPEKDKNDFAVSVKTGDVKEAWLATLSDLNVCSKKGLVEMFDSSIGAGSVVMPYGGAYQLSPTQTMIAKLPVLQGHTDTVTMMSYGYDPYLTSWSPYHGAIYAVVHSVAKIVASGGDYSTIRFTFQEYFKRLGEEAERWGQPFAALLGAYNAQMGFGLPSIGGKDSMSGTFNDIDVPPTLVSFAVDVAKKQDIVTSELKKAGSKLVLFTIQKDAYDLPEYDKVMALYDGIHELTQQGKVLSSYAIGFGGIIEAVSKMAFGNKLGVALNDTLSLKELSSKLYGGIILEMPEEYVADITVAYKVIGEVTKERCFTFAGATISMEEPFLK